MLTFNINQSIRKSFPPPKNNYIKSKFAPNDNKKKQNLKNQKDEKEKSENKSKLNSKRKLQLIDVDDNYNSKRLISKENINTDKNNTLNQKEEKPLIVNNNFGPIINIQAPAINITDKNQIKGKIIKISNNKNIKSKRGLNKRTLNNNKKFNKNQKKIILLLMRNII